MKIRLQAKRIKQAELSDENQAIQSALQYLQQELVKQKRDFDALREEYHRHSRKQEKMINNLWILSEDWKVQS